MAAPELRLEVSLNLLGFRSEIQKLTNIAQNEFTPKINVKFNRQTLDLELNNLQRAIKRRVYRVEIGGNINSFPRAIENIRKQLAELETQNKIEIPISVKNGVTQKEARKARSSAYRSVIAEGGKILLPVGLRPVSQTAVDKFKANLRQKLGSIAVKIKLDKQVGFASSPQGEAGLLEFMRTQGMIGKTASGMTMRMGKDGGDIKQQLNDAVGSAEKIKSIFDGVAKNIATTGKSIANVQGKRLGLGNVPLIAGSVEKKVERSTSAIEGTTSSGALKALYPEINRAITSFVALRGQIQQNTSKLSGFSLIIGLAAFAGVPLAKSIVKLTGSANNFAQLLDNLGLKLEAAVIKAASNILGASSGRLLSGTSLAGLLPPAYRGMGPAASPAGLLPPAYRGIMPARETAGLLGAAPAPAGLLPSVTSRGATGEMMRQLTGGIAPPSSGGGDDAGKLAMSPRNLKERVDAILRDYFKVVEAEIRETFNAPRAIKAQLSQFDALFVQAFDDIQNTIRQVFDTSRKAADKVAKQNQIDVAIQSFVAALEAIVRNAERNAFAQSRIAANKSYVQKANVREVGQPLLGEGRIPRMLPPSTGFYRGPYSEESPGETQSQLFARREREARMRSAQRSLRIASELPPTPRLPGTVFSGDDFTAGGGLDRVRGMGQPPQRGGAIVRHPGGPQLGAATRLPSDYFERGSTTDKYRDGLKLAAAATESFRSGQIPFISGLKSIAGEFGQATKQVLLYGTAYKGLAFITSLPRQILNAAKSQQQFTNGLQSATQGTGTFAKELLYVDNVQRAFGLNLQTTRTGFTKLFASMAPTGFDSGSIEKLFTGISAATASLQLTPDKAERVIYAFGQMASKGQIMSEELKGQLGDVLPGALSLFADAAGMSVKEFSEAMERGEFVGNRFREVFAKVSDELMNRFGSGAQAAAKSLQGLINVVGGDFQRTLESFAPLANAAAESILKPLGGAFRQLSVAAKLATGEKGRLGGQVTKQEQLVQDLGAEAALGGPDAEKAKEQYEGAKKSLEALKITLENFNELAKDPAVIRQAEDIKAFTDEVGKAASFVKNFALSIGGVLSPVLTFLGTNLSSVIGTVISLTLAFQGARLGLFAFAGVMTVIKGAVAAVGLLALVRQVGSFSAALATSGTIGTTVAAIYTSLGIGATAGAKGIIFATGATISFRAAIIALLATTGLGLLIAVVGSVGAAFMAMGQDAKQAAEDAKQAAKDMDEAARTGNVPQVEAGLRQAGADVQLIEDAQKIVRERSAGEQGIYGASTTPTLKPGNLSEIEKNTLAAAGIALPEKGATQQQLNDLLAARKSVLQSELLKGKSRLELAEKQRQRTGQGIPELGIKGTDPPEEDKQAAQRGTSLLNAIEQREEAIAATRKQREESIASIRKNAAQEFMRMEQALADRRLKIEREIVNVKRKSADTLEDIQRQIRIARGEDSDIVGDEQKVADISRRERDANLEIAQRIADEEKEQARNIADFQKKVAKDIQGANEAHTKRMGEIQQGYAKQVAKIIEEGSDKAGKRLAKAAEMISLYMQRGTQNNMIGGATGFVIPERTNGEYNFGAQGGRTGQEVKEDPTFQGIPTSIDNLLRIDDKLDQLKKDLNMSRRPDIGQQFTALLGAEGGYEDIAGLQPLPLQKMLQQIGRPYTELYKQIQDDITGLYAIGRREAMKVLKPDPVRTQKVLQRAEKVEEVRQTWKPLEAQSRELLNRTNPAPRSQPSQASLPTFDKVVRGVSNGLFERLNKMNAPIYGILGDISDYLNEGEREVLKKGIAEQLRQGVQPSRMPVGGNINTGRANLTTAVRELTQELVGNSRNIPRAPAPSALPQSTRQLLLPLGDDSEWRKRFMEQTEPIQITPGVQNLFEGASLPGGAFDVSKVATDFGTIAAASILRGVLDVSRVSDASRGAQIAQAHNVRVGDRVGYYDRPVSQSVNMPGATQATRATEARGRLQSTVQNTAAALTTEQLELLYAQITEDSAKASAEMTRQIGLIKEQAALIKNGINSELAAEFVQLEANYNKEVERIKARKLAVAAEQLLIKQAEKLRDTLKDQTKEHILQAKLLEETTRIRDGMAMARSITPDQEMRTQIAQEGYVGDQAESVFQERKTLQGAQKLKEDMQGIASSIGNSFGEAFKGIITGSMTAQQALAGMFQSIADSFADMAAQMIAEFMRMQALGLLKTIFGIVAPALGAGAGGFSGSAAGFGGSFDAGIPAIGNTTDFSGAFKFANGGIAYGGFRAFANGGIVTGPTLGLVGEGRYNEAVIPLPDGKSVPVDLGGMAGGMGGEVTSNIVVNINNGQMQGNGNSNGSELGRKIEGAVKQVLVSELRPGGILSGGRR
jgi:tape measure domain-containing protein